MDHKLERVLHEVGGVPRIHTHMQIHMCMYANSTSQFYVAPAHFLRDGKTTLPLLPLFSSSHSFWGNGDFHFYFLGYIYSSLSPE